LPQAIRDTARDGDVVITLGAGSIGGVPGQLRPMAREAR
jgi:UDP-N-acetylmuramate--alanine ligase